MVLKLPNIMNNDKMRSIIHSNEADSAILQFEHQNKAFDDLWLGITWRLSREPYGIKVGDNLFLIKHSHLDILIRIIYTIIDDDTIEIVKVDIKK